MQRILLIVGLLLVMSGCSTLNRLAVNRVGDAVSGDGTVFASDPDPDLVFAAMPFGLKTYESLLAASPKHRGLLLAAARGFAAYAVLLQQQGELSGRLDYAASQQLNGRVAQLFLRARNYGLRGLALDNPTLPGQLDSNATAALAQVRKRDVPFLYWSAAAWAGAISASKDNPQLLADLPIVGALIHRALRLDESYDAGAIDEFLVIYEGSRPGGDLEAARRHYRRALALSHGERVSTYLALAENVSVREQNLDEFRTLIRRALAVQPDAVPDWCVANTVARRRAMWLDEHQSDLFINIAEN